MKKQNMIFLPICFFIFFNAATCLASPSEQDSRPNVILFIFDDLNNWVSPLGGHPQSITPGCDRLAEQGVTFRNAHANAVVCTPSRASFLTGLRPTTLGITDNAMGFFREKPDTKDVLTLPQFLMQHGYNTYNFGKSYHHYALNRNLSGDEWTHGEFLDYGPFPEHKLNWPTKLKTIIDWGVFEDPEINEGSWDLVMADKAVEQLSNVQSKPFFMSVGFIRPHTPMYAAQKWFDMHPLDQVQPPKVLEGDNDDLPEIGSLKSLRRMRESKKPHPMWSHDWVLENDKWKEIVQAYLACTTFADHQMLRVLDALEASPHADNTIVIAIGDHGWMLGEKQLWAKSKLWHDVTNVPFFVMGPGIAKNKKTDATVDLLSLYPTIAELCGLPAPEHIEGRSIVPLLRKPQDEWNEVALTSYGHNHHAVTKGDWRYIRYNNGNEELYNRANDPHEWYNLLADGSTTYPQHAELKAELERILPGAVK